MLLDFFNHLWPFILVIVLLVTIHEFGHYFAARACKTHVEAFSIGFGPVLYSKKDKNGTEWRISAIPLGGYIKMLGEYDTDLKTMNSTNPLSVLSKTPLQRFFISVAGPAANFISAIIISVFVCLFLGVSSITNQVDYVSPNGLANGIITKGDKIAAAVENEASIHENDAITSIADITRLINSGKEITLVIEKMTDGETTKYEYVKLDATNIGRKLGVRFATRREKMDFTNSISNGMIIPFKMASDNLRGIFSIVLGKESKDSLSGPIKIAQIIKSSANDIYSVMMLLILLSVSLACMNMLPLPGLDGFTAIISIIEIITRRKASMKVIYAMNIAGLICISALTFLVLYNDISQLSFIQNIFK